MGEREKKLRWIWKGRAFESESSRLALMELDWLPEPARPCQRANNGLRYAPLWGCPSLCSSPSTATALWRPEAAKHDKGEGVLERACACLGIPVPQR